MSLQTRIRECIESGEAHVSSFIKDQDFYDSEFVAKAWVWFMAHNEQFKKKNQSIIVPELKEGAFSADIIEHYTQFWEPVFLIFTNLASACPSGGDEIVTLHTSSNIPNNSNTTIVFIPAVGGVGAAFKVLSSPNTPENSNQMDELLISNEQYGYYHHALVTTST